MSLNLGAVAQGGAAAANPYAAAINAAAGVGTAALKTGGRAFSPDFGTGDAISGAPVNLGGRTYVNGNNNSVNPDNSQTATVKTPSPQTGFADGSAGGTGGAAGLAGGGGGIPPLLIVAAAGLLLIVLLKKRRG